MEKMGEACWTGCCSGGQKVMDGGCGTGRVTVCLAGTSPTGACVIAVDVDWAMVEAASRFLGDRAGAVRSDLTSLLLESAMD